MKRTTVFPSTGCVMKKSALCLVLLGLCGCTRVIIPAGDPMIILQQPVSREVVYCETTPDISAEECADFMEEQGFVRLKDKSVFPGHDDIPQKGSYPTRRFRDKQDIPRW